MIYTLEQLNEMSELDKNVAVYEKLGRPLTTGVSVVDCEKCKRGIVIDYCGDVRAVMPVAFEYKIGLMVAQDCWFAEWFSDDDCCAAGNANPLIAIVDCFLMMEI